MEMNGACSLVSSECCGLTIIYLQAATLDSTSVLGSLCPLLTLLCHVRVTQLSGVTLGPRLC